MQYPTLDEAKKDPRGFHKFLRELYSEQDIQFDQIRAILADASTVNWPYSGTKNCKICGNAIWMPHCFPTDKMPVHNCEKKVLNEETRRWQNTMGMPLNDEQATIDPDWEQFGKIPA